MPTTIGKLYLDGDLEILEGELSEGYPKVQDSLSHFFPLNNNSNIDKDPVIWHPTTNYGVSIAGNSLTKYLGIAAWDSGAISTQSFSGPVSFQWEMRYIPATITTAGAEMVGLNSNHSTWSYTDIDYAIYTHCDGNIRIYHNSVNQGTFSTWDPREVNIFRIDYDGTNVKYYHNETLLSTVTASHSGNLYVDCSMHSHGAQNSIVNAYITNKISDYKTPFFNSGIINNSIYNSDFCNLRLLIYNGGTGTRLLEDNLKNGVITNGVGTINNSATVEDALGYDIVVSDYYDEALPLAIMSDLKDMADAGAVVVCCGSATTTNDFVKTTGTLGTETVYTGTMFSDVDLYVGDSTAVNNTSDVPNICITDFNGIRNIIPIYYHDYVGTTAIMGYLYIPLNENGGSLFFDQFGTIATSLNKTWLIHLLNWQLNRKQKSSRVIVDTGVKHTLEGSRISEFNPNYLISGLGGYSALTTSHWLGATLTEVGTSDLGTPILQYVAGSSSYTYTHDYVLDDDLTILSSKTVTFSLYLRRVEGAATGQIRVYDIVSGYSYYSVSATTEFQRFSGTKTIGASPTRMFVMIDNTGGGTYQFHSPQLEVGSEATEYVNGCQDEGKLVIRTPNLTSTTSINFDFYIDNYNEDGYTTLINNSHYNSLWFWVGLMTSTRYLYMHEANGGVSVSTSWVPTLKTWYNCTVKWNATTQYLYIDGDYMTEISTDGVTNSANIPNLYLGWATPNDYSGNVIFKNLKIYNKELSADEINRLADSIYSFRSDGNLVVNELQEDTNIIGKPITMCRENLRLNGEITEV